MAVVASSPPEQGQLVTVRHHHGMGSLIVSVVELDLFHFRSSATGTSVNGISDGIFLDDERKHPPAGFCR
jgi:hypothetical protein